MKKIFLLICIATSLLACKTEHSDLDVYKQLDEMKSMSVSERGKAFADKVTEYMNAKDTLQEKILQDSTMSWANTLSKSDQEALANAIENEYKEIASKNGATLQ